MSHAFESGFFVVQPPWHGLGTILDDPPETAAQAIIAAGLNWEVSKEPLEATVAVSGTFRAVGVPNHYAMVRRKTENGITRLDSLGVVGRTYHPLQNISAFDFFNRVVQSGLVTYDAAGSLRGGKIVWILARLNGTMRITGDDCVNRFMLLSNSHDGSSPVNIQLTNVRVCCQNTLAMAIRTADKRLSIRHTVGAAGRIRDVGEYLANVNRTFDDSAEAYRYLAQRSINAFQLREYLLSLFPDPEEGAQRNIARANRDRINARFENGYGTDITDTSWWRAFNSVTEFTDHIRHAGNADARVTSAWFGSSMKLKQLALHNALQMAA